MVKMVNKISKKTADKVKEFAKLSYEKFYNWIPTGSGNYENTKTDGKYRENCNGVNWVLKCKNNNSKKKLLYNHCNKLDCSSCFVTGCSIKARKINQRILEFRKLSYQNKIPIGKIIHCSLILNAKKEYFESYKTYNHFKRETIYPMLKEMGIIGGVLFLHIWSNLCIKCGKKEYFCKCEEKEIKKRVNIHIHVIGFGYLINAKEFNKKFQNCIYRNHLPRRTNAYYTIFYTLSKVALWRNGNKKLNPSYNYFGYLHPRKFKTVNKYTIRVTDNCPECNEPLILDRVVDKQIEDEIIYSIKVKKGRYKIEGIEELKKIVENKYKKIRKK